jgi:hypothetical protein
VRVPESILETALSDRGGDALDSLIAAFAAWRAVCVPAGTATAVLEALFPPDPGHYALEGLVYL